MVELTNLLRKGIQELHEVIGDMASVELTLHNEQGQLTTRIIHVREAIRNVSKGREILGGLIEVFEERIKNAPPGESGSAGA